MTTNSLATMGSNRMSKQSDLRSLDYKSQNSSYYLFSSEKMTMLPHVWQYIVRFNQIELKIIERDCSLVVTNGSQVELHSSSKKDLKYGEEEFIKIYQDLSGSLMIRTVTLQPEHDLDWGEMIESKIQCIVSPRESNQLEIILRKSDEQKLDRLIHSVSSKMAPAALTVSKFTPTGYTNSNGLEIYVHMSDITSLRVDAIVDPANSHMAAFAGLAKTIETTAGSQYTLECQRLIQKVKSLRMGQVELTSAGNLPAKSVLHVAGPIWPQVNDWHEKDRQKECSQQLAVTFQNIILKADALQMKSVALPPISSGIFGMPISEVAYAAHSISDVLKKLKYLRQIHFVDISAEFLITLQKFYRTDVNNGHMNIIGDDVVQSTLNQVTSKAPSSIKSASTTPRTTQIQNQYVSLTDDLVNVKSSQDMIVIANQQHNTHQSSLASDQYKYERTSDKNERLPGSKNYSHSSQEAIPYNKSPHKTSLPAGYATTTGIEIYLHRSDITALRVDAIINPDNSSLGALEGLSLVIDTAAGPQYTRERQKVKYLGDGQVEWTSAGSLPAKYVLHVAGPEWPREDARHQQKSPKECLRQLVSTFQNVILKADKFKFSSVALPPISSGIFGAPTADVAHAAHSICEVFSKLRYLRQIHFVDISDEFLIQLQKDYEVDINKGDMFKIDDAVVVNTLKNVEASKSSPNRQVPAIVSTRPQNGSSIVDPASSEIDKVMPGARHKSTHMSKITSHYHGEKATDFRPVGFVAYDVVEMYIHASDLTVMKVDAVVVPVILSLLPCTQLSKAIATVAGREYLQELESRGKYQNPGDVFCTGAGKLPSQYIIHAVCHLWSVNSQSEGEECKRQLIKLFKSVILYADKMKIHSVALPPIGAGLLGAPLECVTEAALEIFDVLLKLVYLKEIHFVDLSLDFLELLKQNFVNAKLSTIDDRVIQSTLKRVKVTPHATLPFRDTSQNDYSLQTTGRNATALNRSMALNSSKQIDNQYGFQPTVITQNSTKTSRDIYASQRTNVKNPTFIRKHFLVNRQIHVYIDQKDILLMNVDAIVNPSDIKMEHYGGLAYRIDRKAGSDLRKQYSTILKWGQLHCGDVVPTGAGSLNFKYIFHAISPHWPTTGDAKKQDKCVNNLEMTFCNIFKIADEKRISSIACPAIGGGYIGIPISYIAITMCEALINAILPTSTLKEIHFVDIYEDTLNQIYEVFKSSEKKLHSAIAEVDDGDIPNSLTSSRSSPKQAQLSPPTHYTNGRTYPIQPAHQNLHRDEDSSRRRGTRQYPDEGSQSRQRAGQSDNLDEESPTAQLTAAADDDMCAAIVLDNGAALIVQQGDLYQTKVSGVICPIDEYTLKPLDTSFSQKVGISSKDISISDTSRVIVRSANGRISAEHILFLKMKKSNNDIDDLEEVFFVANTKQMTSLAIPVCLYFDEYNTSEVVIPQICTLLQKYRLKTVSLVHEKTDIVQRTKADMSLYATTQGLHLLTAKELDKWKTKSGRISKTSHQNDDSSDLSYKIATTWTKGGTTDERANIMNVKPTDDCVICMCPITNPKTLSCKHTFCEKCINEMFKHQPKCPSCGMMFGALKGNQPPGSMRFGTLKSHLAGYKRYGTIMISYSIPSGTQGPEHPSPGSPYCGTQRTAYLPDNPEGREILALLKKAFDAKLIFTVGRSVTTGAENSVIWNDIHHKTSQKGGSTGYGYPDPTYLSRVRQELSAKGIK